MPNRILKATALTSRKLNAVSEGAENLWHRLLLCVDDYGRYYAEPSIVASAAYPLKHGISLSKISDRIEELAKIKLVVLYFDKNEKYLFFTNWDKGNIRTVKSKFPEPDINCKQLQADDSNCKQLPPYSDTDTDTDTDTDARGETPPFPLPEEPEPNHLYGEFLNVRLKDTEYKKLTDKYGETIRDEYIEKLSGYMKSKNKKYTDHYATITNWLRRDNVPEASKVAGKEPTEKWKK